MSTQKKKVFDKRITVEILQAMRTRFLQLPKEMTHAIRATAVAAEFPQFTLNTLEAYSSMCINTCQDVFDQVMAGKISITALAEFSSSWDDKTQKYVATEFLEQKLTVMNLRQIKQLMREHSTMGYAEAISRSKGEIPKDQPRKEQKRSIDQLLAQIADHGARWRALVEMTSEMIGDEEASAGLQEALFQKAFILRQLVKDQYDAINNRVNRFVNTVRKKVKEVNQVNQVNNLEPGQVEIVSPGTPGPKMIDAEFTARSTNDEAGKSPVEE